MGIQQDDGQRFGRQLRFVARVLEVVPRLLEALRAGHVEASQKVGRRELEDGRTVELWIVAKAPRPDRTPLVRGRDEART